MKKVQDVSAVVIAGIILNSKATPSTVFFFFLAIKSKMQIIKCNNRAKKTRVGQGLMVPEMI